MILHRIKRDCFSFGLFKIRQVTVHVISIPRDTHQVCLLQTAFRMLFNSFKYFSQSLTHTYEDAIMKTVTLYVNIKLILKYKIKNIKNDNFFLVPIIFGQLSPD